MRGFRRVINQPTVDIQFRHVFGGASRIAGNTFVAAPMNTIQIVDIQCTGACIQFDYGETILARYNWRLIDGPAYFDR